MNLEFYWTGSYSCLGNRKIYFYQLVLTHDSGMSTMSETQEHFRYRMGISNE